MKQFFKAVFANIFVQVPILLGVSLVKYFINARGLSDKLTGPVLWTSLVLGGIFVVSVGVQGFIENTLESAQNDETKERYRRIQKRLSRLTGYGIAVSAAFGLIVFLYIIAPATWVTALVFLFGIVVWQTIRYFGNNKVTQVGD